MRRILQLPIAAAGLALLAGAVPGHSQGTLFSQGTTTEGIPMGGPYVPAGTLYDNEQSNGTTSLASQDSSTTFTARSADDFMIVDSGCASGQFDVSQIRIQMVQVDASPQAFAIDLFNDDGTGDAPESGINPFDTYAETTQTLLGPFGAGTSIFEASFDTTGLVLDANTVYWISGYGSNAAANTGGFNNFFAASNGATGTTDNGVIIAPGAGVPDWMPVEDVLGPPPLAFSFAIDGTCATGGGGGGGGFDPAIPTLSPLGIALLAVVLALLSVVLIARRRRNDA